MADFDVKYKIVSNDKKNNELIFDIAGTNEYGLDKSIVNAIRRILLTQINTVSFDSEHINIEKNTSSMHNEFLKDRISLVPLNINPENYDLDYLFEINVKNSDFALKKITTEDFIIYPLTVNAKSLIKKQKELISSGGLVSEEDDIYSKIKSNPKEYYNTSQPLSDTEKDKIINPFTFKGSKYYISITELKLTNSDTDIQEIILHCIPIIGIGMEHAKFNNISKSISTFKKDKNLLDSEFDNYVKLQNIKSKDIKKEKKSFEIEKSERYYHRDNYNEPYYYEFTIKSNHFYNPSQLFSMSLDILIKDLDTFKDKINKINKLENYTTATINNFKGENTYQIKIDNESHNTLSIIQNYAVRYFISEESFVSIFGYKKHHPLEDIMIINLMIQPTDYDEIQKINFIIEFINNVIDSINNDLNIMKNKWK